MIVGVGGTRPVPVPRYDRDGRLLGYWENADIATPPVATTDYSDKVETPPLPRQGLYLSWVDEAHLRELAAITGLEYHRLEDFAPSADCCASPASANTAGLPPISARRSAFWRWLWC